MSTRSLPSSSSTSEASPALHTASAVACTTVEHHASSPSPAEAGDPDGLFANVRQLHVFDSDRLETSAPGQSREPAQASAVDAKVLDNDRSAGNGAEDSVKDHVMDCDGDEDAAEWAADNPHATYFTLIPVADPGSTGELLLLLLLLLLMVWMPQEL